MKTEYEELTRSATAAARAALAHWSPRDPDGAGTLAAAIGEAVATALARHEEIRARITAGRMAGIAAEDDLNNWQL